jgi:tetratricopeptide (TPR) repeat protein
MSFLKKLFGSNETGGSANDPLTTQFDADWHSAVRRFAIVSGYGVSGFQFNLRHPQTREILPPHLGIAPYFEDWKQIRTEWDRRVMFFRLILDTQGIENLHVWAAANILTACRSPQEALELLQKAELTEAGSQYYARHCGAYARVLVPLNHPVEALQWAQTAAAADPDDARLSLILADALRLNQQYEAANTIYSHLQATAPPPSEEASDPISELFSRLFALETGAVPSPLFALDVATSLEDPEQAGRFWQLAEAEFYDSPHFRMHHAYRLASIGQLHEAFAKLAALVGEMPWLREPHINLLELFTHLDPEGETLLPDLRRQVEAKIHEEGWTTERMQKIEIPTGFHPAN